MSMLFFSFHCSGVIIPILPCVLSHSAAVWPTLVCGASAVFNVGASPPSGGKSIGLAGSGVTPNTSDNILGINDGISSLVYPSKAKPPTISSRPSTSIIASLAAWLMIPSTIVASKFSVVCASSLAFLATNFLNASSSFLLAFISFSVTL